MSTSSLLPPARERFAVSPAIQAMESTSDDVFLELFLLNFCALGSQMTEPVEVGLDVRLNAAPPQDSQNWRVHWSATLRPKLVIT